MDFLLLEVLDGFGSHGQVIIKGGAYRDLVYEHWADLLGPCLCLTARLLQPARQDRRLNKATRKNCLLAVLDGRNHLQCPALSCKLYSPGSVSSSGVCLDGEDEYHYESLIPFTW